MTHTSTLKMRFRYRILTPSIIAYLKVHVSTTDGKMHELKLPFSNEWVISKAVDITLLKNVENYIIFTVWKTGDVILPVLHLDYMELHREINYELNSVRVYDVDHDDRVRLDFMNGHTLGLSLYLIFIQNGLRMEEIACPIQDNGSCNNTMRFLFQN